MFQYINSCKNRNKLLMSDDRKNVKLSVAINWFFRFSCNIYIYIYIYIYIEIDR